MPHDEQSVFDSRFLNTVETWFKARADIFVVARYSHQAGAREYFWFDNFTGFRAQLERFLPQTDVIVFRDNQFSLRGAVDAAFVQEALKVFPDNTETMVTAMVKPNNGTIHLWYCDNHHELIQTLHDLNGEFASIGSYARWNEVDSNKMISALVPLPDGTLKRGVY